MRNFSHLHVHSHYTLLGGTAPVESLVNQAATDGMSHLALTDTQALYGAVAFDRACRAVNIQPILGMTVAVAWPESLPRPPGIKAQSGYLVLLATSILGYRSLCRISALIQGIWVRDGITRQFTLDDLRPYSEGLICLDGGRRGWVHRCLRAGDSKIARRYAGCLAGIYDENTYLSLELHTPGDTVIAQEMVSIGNFLGLASVAVQPVYALSPDDASRLRLLTAIDHNCPIDAVPDSVLPDEGDDQVQLHWLSPAEVTGRFAEFPAALEQAGAIAARCRPALPSGEKLWPVLPLPGDQTPQQALSVQAQAGLKKRYVAPQRPELQARLAHELDAIGQHGYAPLFLVVADIVNFAREQHIPVSTRGSVANSLVAYCVGITSVDPIEHGLLFERFLSPARADAPDIDVDLCSRRRDEVLDYVRRTYGADRVALVATISTLRMRSAGQEIAKAYELDDVRRHKLLEILPHDSHHSERRRGIPGMDEVLTGVEDEVLRDMVRTVYAIHGQPHHISLHPGAIVITPGPLTDVVPVQWVPKGFMATQFDHKDVEALGLQKIDLLGIRALTVLADAAELVRRDHDSEFQLEDIPLDDDKTGAMLAAGDTTGVFQCESEGARSTLRKLKAHNVQDLAVANAFFKPGPSTGGMARTFVRRYRGEEPVHYLHPALEPILSATQGVLIFQEQILRVAWEIAGLSWAQAGHLRRGMSKFRPDEMSRMEVAFVAGCMRLPPDGPGLTGKQAQTLWSQVQAFSGYGINQGHATAYAGVSYHSAYIRAYWPAAFFCARLQHWGGFHHPAVYMAEALRLGIEVRPPDINRSTRRFTLSWEEGQPVLWMGLNEVRDLRQDTVAALVAARQDGPFSSLRDLLSRVPMQQREIAHLIQCGALDAFGESRVSLLAIAKSVQRAGSVHQMAFEFAQPYVVPETLRQQWAWEKHVLGYPISALRKLLPRLARKYKDSIPLHQLPESKGRLVTVIAVRLPGRPWGSGYYIWDGETWLFARTGKGEKRPSSWEPLKIRGRWQCDQWGTCWLQVQSRENCYE